MLQQPENYEDQVAKLWAIVYEAYEASVSFADEDMLLPTTTHNCPLYMKGLVNGHPMNRILIDSGTAVNLMLYKTFLSLHLTPYMRKVYGVVISRFNQKSQEAIGCVNVDLVLGDLVTKASFFIIDADTSYRVLLGEAMATSKFSGALDPSSMHQIH